MKRLTPLLMLCLLITFSSCDKDEENGDVSLVAAKDNMKAEVIMSDIFKLAARYIPEEPPIPVAHPYACMDTILHENSGGSQLLLKFGDENCLNDDGRMRKGNLQISFSGDFDEEGTIITVVPDNYSLDDYDFSGEITIENMGLNQNDHPEFEMSVADANITAPLDDYFFTRSSSHTLTWIAGSTSNWLEDDIYELSGQGHGIDRLESSYSFNIIHPMKMDFICEHFKSGIMEVTPAGQLVRRVNFGDGNCDKKAIISVNNREYDVNIE